MKHWLLPLLLLTSFVLPAQTTKPQLTWQGYITGGAMLYIQADRVDIQGRETGSVDRPSVRFLQPLPGAPQQVDVRVRRGRGQVEVVEQPEKDNDFTAAVRIQTASPRQELYILNFYWKQGAVRVQSEPVSMSWSGTVDEEAVIEIRGDTVSAQALKGEPVTQATQQFTKALPQAHVNVRLADVRGRGRVELVQQPDKVNDFTALVRISDDGEGASTYSFRLLWDGENQRTRQ